MQNDRNLLEELDEQLRDYKHSLRLLSMNMIDEGISNYPIYVLHENDIDLGKLLLPEDETFLGYSVNASHLEDFVHKGIVSMDAVEKFKKVYKDPKEFLCLFYSLEENPRFVFIPF